MNYLFHTTLIIDDSPQFVNATDRFDTKMTIVLIFAETLHIRWISNDKNVDYLILPCYN